MAGPEECKGEVKRYHLKDFNLKSSPTQKLGSGLIPDPSWELSRRVESLEKALEQRRVELEKDKEKFKELYIELATQDKAIAEAVEEIRSDEMRSTCMVSGVAGIMAKMFNIAAKLEAARRKEGL